MPNYSGGFKRMVKELKKDQDIYCLDDTSYGVYSMIITSMPVCDVRARVHAPMKENLNA